MPVLTNKNFNRDSEFYSQRRKGKNCDVLVKIGNKKYPVHSSVVTKQSPYFTKKLKDAHPNEKGVRVIEFARQTMAFGDLEKIIDYIYGQKLTISVVEPAVRLMDIAKLFEMKQLEIDIVTYLSTLLEQELRYIAEYSGKLFSVCIRNRLKQQRRDMVRFIAKQLQKKVALKAVNTLEFESFRQVLERVNNDEKIKCKSLVRFLAIASWVDSDEKINNAEGDKSNASDGSNLNADGNENSNETNPPKENGNRNKRRKIRRSRAEMAGSLLKNYVTLDEATFSMRGMNDLDEMVAHKLSKENPEFANRLQEKIKYLTEKALGKNNVRGADEQQVENDASVTAEEKNAVESTTPAGNANDAKQEAVPDGITPKVGAGDAVLSATERYVGSSTVFQKETVPTENIPNANPVEVGQEKSAHSEVESEKNAKQEAVQPEHGSNPDTTNHGDGVSPQKEQSTKEEVKEEPSVQQR